MCAIIQRLWHDSVEARGYCLQSEAVSVEQMSVRKLATSPVPIKETAMLELQVSVEFIRTHGNVCSHRLSYLV